MYRPKCGSFISYLGEVQIDETQREELQAHRTAVEEPVDWSGKVVGSESITEVKRKKGGTKGCPEQAKEKESTLVAPPFVAVQ